MKYVTKSALIKVTAPNGAYFDDNNRLVYGIASSSDTTYFWTTVLNVIGDGYNNGEGNFSNGSGPVTLNGYIPTGAIITEVIPSFGNTLPTAVINECVIRMELNQSFSLVFNNSLLITQDRWSIDAYNATGWAALAPSADRPFRQRLGSSTHAAARWRQRMSKAAPQPRRPCGS